MMVKTEGKRRGLQRIRYLDSITNSRGSLVAQSVKSLPSMQETRVRPLGWEGPLEKEMATHSSVLAWKISWTEEPVGCSPWGRTESGMTERLTLTFLLTY